MYIYIYTYIYTCVFICATTCPFYGRCSYIPSPCMYDVYLLTDIYQCCGPRRALDRNQSCRLNTYAR